MALCENVGSYKLQRCGGGGGGRGEGEGGRGGGRAQAATQEFCKNICARLNENLRSAPVPTSISSVEKRMKTADTSY